MVGVHVIERGRVEAAQVINCFFAQPRHHVLGRELKYGRCSGKGSGTIWKKETDIANDKVIRHERIANSTHSLHASRPIKKYSISFALSVTRTKGQPSYVSASSGCTLSNEERFAKTSDFLASHCR